MATTNDVTGDALVSKPTTNNYRDNYDRIFRSDKSPRKGLQHLQTPQAGGESGRYQPTVLELSESDAGHTEGFTSMGAH